MPLRFDFTKIEDAKALHADESEAAITDSLIWATMFCGLDSITEDNLDVWEERLAAVQSNGALMNHMVEGEIKPYFITRKHLERRVGLKTNASKLSKATFKTNIYEQSVRETKIRMARQEAKEAEE